MGNRERSDKVLLTGGAGFVGSHIAEEYLKAGHAVVIVDDLSTGQKENIPKGACFYKVDITDKGALAEIFKREKPTVVNHQAAQIDIRTSLEKPEVDADINIIGTIHLLEQARLGNVRKFIFASSGGALCGECPKGAADESSPIRPCSHYGVSKKAAEDYIQLYRFLYGLPFTLLRYANVYGPRQNRFGEAGVITLFILGMLQNKEVNIYGDGNQVRDFVYVADVAEANLKTLHAAENKAVNISSGTTTSVNRVFESLKEKIGYSEKPRYLPKREGEIYRSRLANSLAKKTLHWKPNVIFNMGLQKTVEWFRHTLSK